jgi:hypothetical protein
MNTTVPRNTPLTQYRKKKNAARFRERRLYVVN